MWKNLRMKTYRFICCLCFSIFPCFWMIWGVSWKILLIYFGWFYLILTVFCLVFVVGFLWLFFTWISLIHFCRIFRWKHYCSSFFIIYITLIKRLGVPWLIPNTFKCSRRFCDVYVCLFFVFQFLRFKISFFILGVLDDLFFKSYFFYKGSKYFIIMYCERVLLWKKFFSKIYILSVGIPSKHFSI